MKTLLLFFVLLNFSVCRGEYKNVERSGRRGNCGTSALREDIINERNPTVSDCVDRQLDNGKGFYDKCCYIRGMLGGKVLSGCIGLKRSETMDVPGAIPIAEDDLKRYMLEDVDKFEGMLGFKMTEGQDVKIYSIDCDASYIKFFASIFALFCLLF